jgi:hypothetical protein
LMRLPRSVHMLAPAFKPSATREENSNAEG